MKWESCQQKGREEHKPEIASQYPEGNAVDGQLSLSGCAVGLPALRLFYILLLAAILLQEVIFSLNHFSCDKLQHGGQVLWLGPKMSEGRGHFLVVFVTGEHLLCQHILQGWQCKH